MVLKAFGASLLTCLALYSRIPAPQMAWSEGNTRYTLGFLPLIGVLLGGLEYCWFALAGRIGVSALLYAAIAVLLPVILTGGIHMDGFLDTCDAVSSFGTPEKKLEILSDPHAGAFGTIYTVCLILLQTAVFAQIYEAGSGIHAALPGFVFSRVIGGGALILIPYAKKTGMGYQMGINSNAKGVCLMLGAFALAGLMYLFWQCGAGAALVALALLMLGAVFIRRFALRLVGGITGDLCGFVICIIETAFIALGAVIGLMAN